jgi:hypothetical protein
MATGGGWFGSRVGRPTPSPSGGALLAFVSLSAHPQTPVCPHPPKSPQPSRRCPAPPARRKHAWGADEVNVLGRQPVAWFQLGLTIVDSLDTLLIAGLEEEYQEVRCGRGRTV